MVGAHVKDNFNPSIALIVAPRHSVENVRDGSLELHRSRRNSFLKKEFLTIVTYNVSVLPVWLG